MSDDIYRKINRATLIRNVINSPAARAAATVLDVPTSTKRNPKNLKQLFHPRNVGLRANLGASLMTPTEMGDGTLQSPEYQKILRDSKRKGKIER